MSAEELIAARALCRKVLVATPLVEWVARVLRAMDPHDGEAMTKARRFLRAGPGVRGGQAMVLAAKARALTAGRAQVSMDDLRRVALPALRHRVLLNFEGESEGVNADALVREAIEGVKE
ncbi:MAG: hypothetical protein R3A52_14920 [Polyangiales bacterium]